MTVPNFPQSPTPGEEFVSNGITYVWNENGANEGYWEAQASASGTAKSGPLAGFRNQLINGDFRVAQRGANITTGGVTAYALDRWYISSDTTMTRGGNWGSSVGLPVTARMQNTSVNSSFLRQGIELNRSGRRNHTGTYYFSWYTTAAAGDVEVSIQYLDDVPSTANSVALTVGDVEEIEAADADGFRRLGCSVDMDSALPVATNTALSIGVRTSSADYYVSGYQFEPGAIATPFELRPFGTELALCQRYLYKVSAKGAATKLSMFPGLWRNTTKARIPVAYPQVLRSSPTLTTGGNIEAMFGNSFATATDINLQAHNEYAASLDITVASGPASAGGGAALRLDNTTDSFISFDAEL